VNNKLIIAVKNVIVLKWVLNSGNTNTLIIKHASWKSTRALIVSFINEGYKTSYKKKDFREQKRVWSSFTHLAVL